MKFLIKYLILFVVFFAVAKQPQLASTPKIGAYTNLNSTIGLINYQRKIHGLKPLQVSSQLNSAAYSRAVDLYSNNQWSHAGFQQAVDRVATSRKLYGENLGADIPNNEQLVNMWMNSPSHKANILNSTFRYVGFSRYQNYAVVWFSQ